ncbi:alpha/beta hydrolase [Nonomuraea sp. NBC_01738]|uniref:alpha/beta fold hydrolase n=1 Tax=Nonomuraea sp. NBC_01738 TaxID=2976003 RepID=UPI002E1476DF|nr:alpha/beta hydrolase [Nonomuraea sp. NBC_01738]
MPTFSAADGTLLSYRVLGEGDPLVCLPGGPADSAYLGELGGLSAHRRLVMLDLRGTGRSAVPEDPASYRCDRLVDDVEALRARLGLPVIDVFGHSAGANLATLYAARHPARVGRLVLAGPGTRAVGIEIGAGERLEVARLRAGEPWFAGAFAALEAITEGRGADWEAIAPLRYGRWDAAARAHHAAGQPDNERAVAGFGAEGAFDPPATRAALAGFAGAVLVLTGEFDLNSPPSSSAALAGLFAAAALVVQAGGGHFPWLDDPLAFTRVVAGFLARG